MNSTQAPPGRGSALLARFGALGDMVMLTPALEVLSQRGQRPCEVVTSLKIASAVYSGLPSVGAVTLVHSKRTPYLFERSQQKFVRGLRRRVAAGRVTSGLSFSVVPRVPWLLNSGGLDPSQVVSHQDLPRGELEHDVAYGERMVRELHSRRPSDFSLPRPEDWPCPRLEVSKSERSETQAWLHSLGWRDEPLVLLQSQSRKARRGRWPEDHWSELARRIRSKLPDAWILFTGIPSEQSVLEPLAASVADPRVVCVAGAMNFRRLCAVMAVAHSTVSLDTGPAHVAAALGCPLAVLFGSEHPYRTRPTPRRSDLVAEVSAMPEDAWPDSRQEFAERHRMQDISLDAVLDAWSSLPDRTRR